MPIRDYGVVLDCGSSGTRVFVYTWLRPAQTQVDTLLDIVPLDDEHGAPVQLKVEPGLSSFADDVSGLEGHITPLISLAEAHIPPERHAETVFYMLATAGMRMLPVESQNSILGELRRRIPRLTNFYFAENHAAVITGKEEGLFAWISANYVLGRLRVDDQGQRAESVGIIDMGGGSTQIAFEVPEQGKVENADFVQFNLGATDSTHLQYRLYVTTHLGFGANVANSKYREMLMNQFDRQDQAIADPCLPPGATVESGGVEFIGAGNYTQCYQSLRPLLHKESCAIGDETCALDGHYQPSMASLTEFFGFSEFYYTSADCLGIAGRWNLDLFQKESAAYCATNWEQLKINLAQGKYKADENRLRQQCFKSAWVPMVLHQGFNFPKHGKKLTTLQSIGGTEVQWALGALIYKSRFLPLRQDEVTGVATHVHHISSFDSSLVLLIICMSLVIGFLLINLKRIISQNRSTVYVRLPTRRRLEEDIV